MYVYINLAAVCLYVYKQYFSNCETEIETISNFYPGLFWAKKKINQTRVQGLTS